MRDFSALLGRVAVALAEKPVALLLTFAVGMAIGGLTVAYVSVDPGAHAPKTVAETASPPVAAAPTGGNETTGCERNSWPYFGRNCPGAASTPADPARQVRMIPLDSRPHVAAPVPTAPATPQAVPNTQGASTAPNSPPPPQPTAAKDASASAGTKSAKATPEAARTDQPANLPSTERSRTTTTAESPPSRAERGPVVGEIIEEEPRRTARSGGQSARVYYLRDGRRVTVYDEADVIESDPWAEVRPRRQRRYGGPERDVRYFDRYPDTYIVR